MRVKINNFNFKIKRLPYIREQFGAWTQRYKAGLTGNIIYN